MQLSRASLLVLISIAALAGCSKADTNAKAQTSAEASADPSPLENPVAQADRSPALAGPTGATPRAGAEALAAGPAVAEDEDKEDEKKDYWADIHFSLANFEEVREYVKTYYIEADINESQAYIEAANSALLEMDPPREILPTAFYKARKGLDEEEGRLKGRTYRLKKKAPYVIHIIPSKKELEKHSKRDSKKRLSDDEIRELREQSRKRRKLYEETWSRVQFGEQEFVAVLDHIRSKLPRKAGDKAMRKFHVAAAQGYLYSLDPHSSLISAAAWDESTRSTTDSSFEGIGAILTQRNDETIVESPLEGRPAHRAGVRAGDKIVSVDGKDIRGLPLHKVVKRIRGKKGTTVKLGVVREGDPEEKVFAITRAHIPMENVSGGLMEPHHPGIAYIKITGFVPTTETRTKALYEQLKVEHAKLHDGAELRGIILDLRNNSGGLLQQGVKIADLFVDKGKIVEVRNRVRRDEVYRAKADGTWKEPVIVLVNDGSASASEIVASAIQDNGDGLLVGDRTFGKASVQTLFSPILRKDYYIKLTIARYFSPSGRTIQVTGVAPDFEVAPDVKGKMPLGFREENLSHFLKPIQADYKRPNPQLVKEVKECADLRGIAERVHANDPNPQLKYDFQKMKAADFMTCYVDLLKRGVANK